MAQVVWAHEPDTGVWQAPHWEKADIGGEDGYVLARSQKRDRVVMGVLDGVGGSREDHEPKTKVSGFVRDLSQQLEAALVADSDKYGHAVTLSDAVEMAQEAVPDTGACTTLALCDLRPGEPLRIMNLGDSQIGVFRSTDNGMQMIHLTDPQQYLGHFNMPYALSGGAANRDMLDATDYTMVDVEAGDIIVAATDGLWDNQFTDWVTKTVADGVADRLGAAGIAQTVGQEAAEEAGSNRTVVPFYLNQALAEGKPLARAIAGGKMDDITVVVLVVPETKTVPADPCEEVNSSSSSNDDCTPAMTTTVANSTGSEVSSEVGDAPASTSTEQQQQQQEEEQQEQQSSTADSSNSSNNNPPLNWDCVCSVVGHYAQVSWADADEEGEGEWWLADAAAAAETCLPCSSEAEDPAPTAAAPSSGSETSCVAPAASSTSSSVSATSFVAAQQTAAEQQQQQAGGDQDGAAVQDTASVDSACSSGDSADASGDSADANGDSADASGDSADANGDSAVAVPAAALPTTLQHTATPGSAVTPATQLPAETSGEDVMSADGGSNSSSSACLSCQDSSSSSTASTDGPYSSAGWDLLACCNAAVASLQVTGVLEPNDNNSSTSSNNDCQGQMAPETVFPLGCDASIFAEEAQQSATEPDSTPSAPQLPAEASNEEVTTSAASSSSSSLVLEDSEGVVESEGVQDSETSFATVGSGTSWTWTETSSSSSPTDGGADTKPLAPATYNSGSSLSQVQYSGGSSTIAAATTTPTTSIPLVQPVSSRQLQAYKRSLLAHTRQRVAPLTGLNNAAAATATARLRVTTTTTSSSSSSGVDGIRYSRLPSLAACSAAAAASASSRTAGTTQPVALSEIEEMDNEVIAEVVVMPREADSAGLTAASTPRETSLAAKLSALAARFAARDRLRRTAAQSAQQQLQQQEATLLAAAKRSRCVSWAGAAASSNSSSSTQEDVVHLTGIDVSNTISAAATPTTAITSTASRKQPLWLAQLTGTAPKAAPAKQSSSGLAKLLARRRSSADVTANSRDTGSARTSRSSSGGGAALSAAAKAAFKQLKAAASSSNSSTGIQTQWQGGGCWPFSTCAAAQVVGG